MLNAILHGKKHGSGFAGVRLLDDFAGAEDTLTATVFERLLYLPDDILIRILFDPRVWIHDATNAPTEIRYYEFWPWWGPPKSKLVAELGASSEPSGQRAVPAATEDQHRIQPDLVINFDNRVLIIEAKRWDFHDMQCPKQLAGQYVRASDRCADTPAWLLAVGGLPDGRWNTKLALRENVLCELRKLDWALPNSDFHFAALAWHEVLKVTFEAIHEVSAHRRLIADLREGVSAHGIRVEPPQWLTDLTTKSWRNSVGEIIGSPAVLRSGLAQTLQTLLSMRISTSSVTTLAA